MIHAALPDRDGIARLIPHQGRMCLLDQVLEYTPQHIRCAATSHADAANPLRCGDGLPATAAIEYAAQAMALHGALNRAATAAAAQRPGYLASARQVRLLVPRLDTVAGRLIVQASLQAGDTRQAVYRFALGDEDGRVLVDGRAAVVLDSPLATP